MSLSREELERLLREAKDYERPRRIKGEKVSILDMLDKPLIFEDFEELQFGEGETAREVLHVQAVDVEAKKRIRFFTQSRILREELSKAREEGRWPLKAKIVRSGRAFVLSPPEE